MKIVVDVLDGDVMINNFMHCCDVFESGKQLAEYNQLEMELELTGDDPIDLNKFLTRLRLSFEEMKRNVVFMSIVGINGKRVNDYTPYIKTGIQTISNGRKFGLFSDILKRIGYDVETNQHMVVTGAKLII